MLKLLFLSLLLIRFALTQHLHSQNNIPVIDVFVESLCPDCMDFIGDSFKQFQEALDHQELAVVNFYPFGNAKESWDGSKWIFECQHGPNECYGNIIEACALNHLSENEGKNFLICLEGNIKKFNKNFDDTLAFCVSEESVMKNIKDCANGSEGNGLMHEVAQRTPKHNYVPWIHFNGEHDKAKENQILQNMLKFLRSGVEYGHNTNIYLENNLRASLDFNENKSCLNNDRNEMLNFLS